MPALKLNHAASPIRQMLRTPGNLSNATLCTVHIKLYPTPTTFTERREVLRVLERFGEVAMFRSLKHHPSRPVADSFLSLYCKESSAEDIVTSSPLRYKLISTPATPTPTSSDEANIEPQPIEREFELWANRTTFDHNEYLGSPTTNPLHGPYVPVEPSKSYIGAAIEPTIPDTLWSAGLLDWETDSVHSRNIVDFDPNAGKKWVLDVGLADHKMKSLRPSASSRIAAESTLPEVMKGLKKLKENRAAGKTEDEAGEASLKIQRKVAVGSVHPLEATPKVWVI